MYYNVHVHVDVHVVHIHSAIYHYIIVYLSGSSEVVDWVIPYGDTSVRLLNFK